MEVSLSATKAQMLKSMFYERSGHKGACGVKKKFQKTLILVFEVIVQPPKRHFFTFSNIQKTHYGEKKSETKIMKIAYSATILAISFNNCNII